MTTAAHHVELIMTGTVHIAQGVGPFPSDREWFVCCELCGVNPSAGAMPEMDTSWRGELPALAARDAPPAGHGAACPGRQLETLDRYLGF